MTVDGGSDVVSYRCYLAGGGSSQTGTVTVSGDGSTWTNSVYLYIGDNGIGTLNITNGGAVIGGLDSMIGQGSSSTGVVTVSGAGSTWTDSSRLHVGDWGDGTLNIADGGLVEVSGNTHVAYRVGSTGAINFNNGTLTTGGFVADPSKLSGTGTINTNGFVGDVDMVFDAASGLVQTFTLNDPGQNITVNLMSPDGSGSIGVGCVGNGSMQISDGLVVQSVDGYLGYQSGSTGVATVSGTGSTWANSGDLYVGRYGNGTLEITDGGVVSSTYGYIGEESASATGAVTVSGTGSTWTNSALLGVGGLGQATLDITDGGTVNCHYARIAGGRYATAVVTVSGVGSTFANSNRLHVGGDSSSNGTLEITNGGAVSNTFCNIGNSSNSTGVVRVSGDGSTWTNSGDLYIGRSGNGIVEITDGGAVSNADSYIGYNSYSSTGEVTVSGVGSTWTSSGSLRVGYENDGTLEITDGGVVSSASGYIGYGSRSTGLVTVDGESSTWTDSGTLYVGRFGGATLNITNGGAVSNTYGYIGYGSGAGLVTVSGTGSTWANSDGLYVGREGDGTLNITNGGAVSSASGSVGSSSDSKGVVTVSGAGSTWTDSRGLYIGIEGSGTLTIADGGLVDILGNTHVSYNSTASGTINFDNGTLTTGGFLGAVADLSGAGTINAKGLVSDVDLVFDASHGLTQTLTVNDSERNITINLDVGDLAPMGAGYAGEGSTRISDGMVIKSPRGYIGYQAGSTGVVTVDGAGSIWTIFDENGNVYGGGMLSVGMSGAATLTIINGGLVSAAGDIPIVIDHDGDGDSFINMATGGMLAVYKDCDDSLSDFLARISGTDAIQYWDASSSNWAPITDATPGVDYRLDYLTEGDLAGYTVLTVPEPATLSMLALGGLAVLRRRRRYASR
ncbi:MAG: PEP-CTERM sorting domain-containing protein [bacterium]|nr:PEP-CTERM sorting domain-containing protein [bacterium]